MISDAVMTDAIELAKELRGISQRHFDCVSVISPIRHNIPCCVTMDTAADVLESQSARIAELERENETLRKVVRSHCEDIEAVREHAKRVLPAAKVDGDSYSVPSIVDLMEWVVGELEKLKQEKPC